MIASPFVTTARCSDQPRAGQGVNTFMTARDRIFLAAIGLSVALHLVALFGTPRFDLGWMYEEKAPTPIEVQLVPPPKPPKPAAAPRSRMKLAERPRPRAAAPVASSKPSEPIPVFEAPSPDGEPIPSVAEAGEPAGAATAETTAEAPAAEGEPEVARPEVEYPLREARLVFDLYYGRSATKIGQVTHTWNQEGDRYAAESVAEAVGFISFFFGGRFVQRSIGQFTKTGLLPELYTLERGRGDKPEVARFDRAEGKLALAWKNESRVFDLPRDAQDPVSMLHQLYFIQPVPTTARLHITTGRKLNLYVYQLVGEEQLETPLGMLTTLHFRRQEADGTLMDVWLDLHRSLLPARIHLVDRKGGVLDQIIREARLEPREPNRAN
jgi:hypothetical protein